MQIPQNRFPLETAKMWAVILPETRQVLALCQRFYDAHMVRRRHEGSMIVRQYFAALDAGKDSVLAR